MEKTPPPQALLLVDRPMLDKTVRHRQMGTFKARFSPPAAPRFVLKHLTTHPLTWTWTTKEGPNKGRSFQVPTIPIVCEKAAPKAIHWIVAVFHSFKTHLNPVALDSESGKVKQGWLRLYQNNLYIHLQGQMKVTTAPKRPPPIQSLSHPPPTAPPPGPPTTENVPESELSKLCKEIADLREKFNNYITSHEACCLCHSNPHSETSSKVSDSPNPVTIYALNNDGSMEVDPNPPSWLVTALGIQDLPSTFQGNQLAPPPLSDQLFPHGTLEVIKLIFDGTSPLYLGTHRDGQLWVSATAERGMVSTTYKLPHDPSTPTLPPKRR
ncbi:hypothetical protein EDC04DRAFT_2604467 [Pisolithus marmoratus]|nr:hypothetical protein EDC04DRAFT_2604467 [Pisolithus marmoratus]